MKKNLFAVAAATTLSTTTLAARVLLCEECLPEPECIPHLFVERCEWRVHGEFLYWGGTSGTLDYAVKMNSPVGPSNTFLIGKFHTAGIDFSPGFRIGTSYYNCQKYWEVTAAYTWLKSHGKTSQSAPTDPNEYLVPTRNLNLFGPFASAHSDLSFGYQVGDVYAARVFDPNPHLRMHVYGGATVGWLDQDWEINYFDQFGNQEKLNENWRFLGGGLRFGMTANWFWGCQFYLTGRVSIATLFGSYENKERQKAISSTIANTIYDENRFAFNVQFILGPSWQLPCECWSFELFAGYESNLWFNLQERIRSARDFISEPKETFYASSVLGLQGLTLRLTIGF